MDDAIGFRAASVQLKHGVEQQGGSFAVVFPSRGAPSGPQTGAARMVFSLGTLGPRFPDALRNWFTLDDVAGTALDLHFASRYQPEMYTDVRFLLAAQAIEALHRHHGERFKHRRMARHDFKDL